MDHDEQTPVLREANRRVPRLLVVAGVDQHEEGIEEDLASLLEGNMVLEDVGGGLLEIPLECLPRSSY